MFPLDVSGCAPFFFPTLLITGYLSLNEKKYLITEQYPFQGEWGKIKTCKVSELILPLPYELDISWVSIVEYTSYSIIKNKLPIQKMESLFAQTNEECGDILFDHFLVGMAPYGGVALWLHGFKKSALVAWMRGEETQADMNAFMPNNQTITVDALCEYYINNDSLIKQNLATNGLPPRDLFDNYMKQFIYRYLPLLEHWDEDEEKWQPYTEREQEKIPELDYVEEALFDGTYDKLHDGGLMQYHEAGKPKKLAVKWHIDKSEYTAYFWFEDDAIRSAFDRFYGIHPDTKTDFIIHIDPEKKKYQLALYRYGLQEPKIIPEDAYQLIVFKNKFEQYRSPNYDQPRGAWIW